MFVTWWIIPTETICPNRFGDSLSSVESHHIRMTAMPHAGIEPITDHVHHNSWSANFEKPRHADDRDLVIAQGLDAARHTASDHHVNSVTHGNHGHPSEFLFGALADEFDGDVEWEYIEQCGCGGHVTRVDIE